MRSRKEN